MPEHIGILLIDDHPILLLALTHLIEQEDGLSVCGQAEDAGTALKMILNLKPGLVILDISLPDGSGLQLINRIHARDPHLPILVFSMYNEVHYAVRALRLGARGYVMKQAAAEKILVAIRQVVQGNIYVSDQISSNLLRTFVDGRTTESKSPVERLTNRELEVLQFLGQGYGTRQIAEKLYLSVKTIHSYREHLKEKLSLSNASELGLYAVSWVQFQQLG